MSDGSITEFSQQHKLDQDHLRERKQRHKWHLGEANPTDGHPRRRPNKPVAPAASRLYRHLGETHGNKTVKMGRINSKRPGCPDTGACLSDCEEDVKDACTGSALEAAYTYSYDRPHGPSKGSQILGQAIIKAVEKCETKVTEKLVKDEYEVVANEKDDTSTGSSAEEDDFELL